MAANKQRFTSNDFSPENFPEFFSGNVIDDVLTELNSILLEALVKEGTGLEPRHVPDSTLIETLRADMLNSPYLYLSGSLIDQLQKA
jgi:hypothetical protein